MGKASRKKRITDNEVPADQGRRDKESKPSKRSRDGLRNTTLGMALVLLAISFVVYFNAFSGDFVYDDKEQVVNNPWIRDAGNIPTIFSKSVWSFRPDLSTWNYYRPLMHIVYLFNFYVFGLNPWGFHLINILFHAGATVLVFLIIRRLLDHGDRTSSSYLSPPFLAAALFAAHPVHTEAVTWIAGLPDVSFAFFYLLSFYLYILFRDGYKRGYLLSISSFSVAVFFKEPALTLPVLLITCDYLMKKFDRTLISGVMRYIPFIAVSGIYLLARYYALGSLAPMESYAGLSSYQFIINIFPLFREYLTDLLWPFNLTFWHTFHPISTLSGAVGIISVAAAVVFIIISLVAFRKNKILFFGLLLIIVPLLPAFYIKGISGKPYAERYLYLPSAGYVLFLALLLSWVRDKLPRAAKSITIIFMMTLGIYSVGTIYRNNVWKDDFHLWSDTVRKSADCAIAHNELARALVTQGQLDQAVSELQTALRLKPDSAEAHISLGNIYASQGRQGNAIEEFQAALRLKPKSAAAHDNLARVQGRMDKVSASRSDNADSHISLAGTYVTQGRFDKAISELQTALSLNPDNAIAHVGLGNAYAAQRQMDSAITEFKTAIRIDTDIAIAHVGLGNAYGYQGRFDKAIAEFQAALRLKSDSAIGSAIAHVGLGNAYASEGQIDKAISEFQTALKLKPDLKEAQLRLNELTSKRR